MNTDRKVELLYKKAKKQKYQCTKEEQGELAKYKIGRGEKSFYTTKANIKEYVHAVDKEGFKRTFYDWCMDNGKADKRRIGSDKYNMRSDQMYLGLGAILWGMIMWGMAFYLTFRGIIPGGICAIAGMIVGFVLARWRRRWIWLTLFIIPILICSMATMREMGL